MKKKFTFTKMHSIGNDFIMIDAMNQRLEGMDYSQLAIDLCNRHFGIGADGLILILNSERCDLKMRIFNSDGSEAEMCGNGIRCFARFAFENKLIEKEIFSVETLAGIIVPALVIQEGSIIAVEVDMGKPILAPNEIPIKDINTKHVIAHPIEIEKKVYHFTAVSMGNPHAIIFVDQLKSIDIKKIGPLFENHTYFPNKINVEFTQILNRQEAVVKVWERGAGETLACGTGACAVVVAGVLNQLLDRKVLIHLPGGDLRIEWQQTDDHIIMIGDAQNVFKGEIAY